MKRILLCFVLLTTGLFVPKISAQTEKDSLKEAASKQTFTQWLQQRAGDKEYYEQLKKQKLEALETEKENVAETEKFELKKQLEKIDKSLENGTITEEKATALKKEAAKKTAQNIDNKTAIINNQIELTQRDVVYNYQPNAAGYIELGFGNAIDDKGSFLLGVKYKAGDKKPKYDKRTYSDVVIKWGFLNTVGNGRTIGDSYKFWRSGSSELGIALKTRLLKDSNKFRLSYGLSYQVSKYSPGSDLYFVNNNGTTVLEKFPHELKQNFLKVENLIVPVYFEFGPSVKKEYKDYFRYDTTMSYKVGLGGYAGINTGAMQQLKYNVDGERVSNKNRSDYNVSKFVYGLDGYVGFGGLSIYARYELNTLFTSSAYKDHAISFGFRIDM